MSRLVGRALNRELLGYLTGDPASKKGSVVLVATTDQEGWPHLAMLSHWEIVAKDRKNLRVATYTGSKTTANMKERGKVTAIAVDGGMTYYIKGSARVVREEMKSDAGNTMLNVRVDEVLRDELPGAEIVSGIQYREVKKIEPHELLHKELVEG
jgi:Pyridoxamine 5'-phosphate oxidase